MVSSTLPAAEAPARRRLILFAATHDTVSQDGIEPLRDGLHEAKDHASSAPWSFAISRSMGCREYA
jgi:hypothetical protein